MEKVTTQVLKPNHQMRSIFRFLNHLHHEIEIAEKLEDIQDDAILNKFMEYIEILKQDWGIEED